MTTLRLGLAGLGHGDTLLKATEPENEVPIRVTALCDVNEELLETRAKEHGIEAITTDFDELAARDDIDIIGIYTPGPLHERQILTALENGKHVMVTKSMVYTMEEAETVVEAVDRTRQVLLVTQSLRGRLDFMDRQARVRRRRARRTVHGGIALRSRSEAGLRAHALAHYDAAGPDPGRRLPPHRPAALVHG